ncbi:DUF4350 domain-containing protein [Chloroflexota bacterium]
MEDLHYSVSDDVFSTFRLPEDAGLALMLEPSVGITPDEWQKIDAWVEEGGTLVLAGDEFGTALAARHYQFNLAYLDPQTTTATTQTPLLVSPPANPANAQPRAYLKTNRDDFVTHLAFEDQPMLVSFEYEAGRVILSAAAFPFSNAGLKEEGNPALVLNLISTANQPGVIWFNEWHHGLRAGRTEIVGPGNWLRYTPTGRSLLYTAAVIFVALLLRGWRFGRPVPLLKDTARRAPLEYITAIANLGRRAGHRSAVLRQYHHWLKRGLGQRYRLNPTLPDKEYLEQLAQFNPNLDTPALRDLLRQLQRRNISESEMIQLAAEVAKWLKES